MPVFARTKLLIHDYCLQPKVPFITLKYSGPNPQNVYPKVKELLISVWKLEPGDVQERVFNWDRSGDVEKFKISIEAVKDLDAYSFYYLKLSIKGEAKLSKEFGKEGKVTIEFEPALRTEYPQDTLWQRSLLYELFRTFYHKVIYRSTRLKYIQECRELSMRFQEEIKSFLNLLPKSY